MLPANNLIGNPDAPNPRADTARCNACSNPTIEAFTALIQAVERNDARKAVEQTRALRRLGYSVCVVTPFRKGGA